MMKKLIALMMALAMVLCMAACGSEGGSGSASVSSSSETKEETIIGSWEGEMDLTEAMEEIMSESLGMDVKMEDIALEMTFTFNKDGSLECEVDEKSAEKMAENLIDSVVEVMIEALEKEGVDLEAEGMTEDDLREMMEESFDVDDMIESMTESFDGVYYIYEDGYVYTGSDLDELEEDPEENSDETWEITLKNGKMKIIDIVDADGESLEDIIPGALPMTFTKK